MEFVYVVKRSDLFDLHFPHGFLSHERHRDEVDVYLDRVKRGFFVERRHAEQDSSLKQIIPYTIVLHEESVLLLRRSKKGGDARLHDKLSIGVGGHVNPPDAEHGLDDLLALCTNRELDEELVIEGTPRLGTIGVINDDSNPVGSVHFGVVGTARVDTTNVAVRETELLTAQFVSRDELRRLAEDPSVNLETWSRLIALDDSAWD